MDALKHGSTRSNAIDRNPPSLVDPLVAPFLVTAKKMIGWISYVVSLTNSLVLGLALY